MDLQLDVSSLLDELSEAEARDLEATGNNEEVESESENEEHLGEERGLIPAIQVERNERARYLRSQRISQRTRRSYESHIKQFIEYLEANQPELLTPTKSIRLQHLNLSILDNFFTEMKSRRKGEHGEHASLHVLNASRAAIRSYFIDENMPIPSWFEPGLKTLFQGFKKVQARKDREQGVSARSEQGKTPFSFTIFHFLMSSIFRNVTPNPFAHLFGLLSWNLMCRGDNTASLNLKNMGWYEDALTLRLGHAKNDQTGEHSVSMEPKHIYANPLIPEICPILSLGIYLSTCFNAPGESSLFFGERQKDRMLQNIPEYLKKSDIVSHMQLLGVSSKDYGNHSFRKGAATFVASGSVGGPSIVSVLRRAGWTLGDTLGRYLKADPAGNQYSGRVVCGLPVNSNRFAVLPPRLRVDDQKISCLIESQFKNASTFRNLWPVLAHCLASLIFHEKFLKTSLPKDHPIFNTHIFAELTSYDRDQLNAVCDLDLGTTSAFDLESSQLSGSGTMGCATGIPPHVVQLVYLYHLQKTPEKIVGAVKAMLEARDLMPTSVVTVATLQAALKDLQIELLAEVKNLSRIIPYVSADGERIAASTSAIGRESDTRVFWHLWSDGKYRRIPEGFNLPKKCSLEIGWRLWFLGNKEKKVSKLCGVDPSDFKDRKHRKTFCEWKTCISFFLAELKSFGTILNPDDRSILDMEIVVMNAYQDLFKNGIMKSTKRIGRTVRQCQKSILSLAKEIRKKKA